MGGKITSILQHLVEKGLNKVTVARALCGTCDVSNVNEVCVAILADIEKKRQLEADGETHVVSRGLALPDSLINRFAYDTLRLFNEYEQRMALPVHLLGLIKTQLQIYEPDGLKAKQYVASTYLVARHPDAGNRKIAAAVECDHTTIRRWRKKSDFQLRVEFWKKEKDDGHMRDAKLFQSYLKRIDEFSE